MKMKDFPEHFSFNNSKKSVDALTNKWLKLGVHELDSSSKFYIKELITLVKHMLTAWFRFMKKNLPVRIIVSTVNSLT